MPIFRVCTCCELSWKRGGEVRRQNRALLLLLRSGWLRVVRFHSTTSVFFCIFSDRLSRQLFVYRTSIPSNSVHQSLLIVFHQSGDPGFLNFDYR